MRVGSPSSGSDRNHDRSRSGRIILINGTSSSGKTTLAKGLQSTLPDLWLEMGIDRFAYALPGCIRGVPTWPQLFQYVRPAGRSDGPFAIETTPLGQEFISGMHATVAALADAGLHVIVDHLILEQRWLEECARMWARFEVLFVGWAAREIKTGDSRHAASSQARKVSGLGRKALLESGT